TFGEDQHQDSPGRPNDKDVADNIHERNPVKLTNHIIWITGGSAGIGLALALKFLELGNQVIVTRRSQSVIDELKVNYPKLHTIQSDVGDPTQIAALAGRVKAGLPKVDILMTWG